MLRRTCVTFLLLACISLATADELDQEEARRLQQQGQILAVERLLDTAMRHYPQSRLLEVELQREHQQYRYELELLTHDGQVRELEFDAATGQLLSDEEEL